jgi:beta-galactosidase beta subunit
MKTKLIGVVLACAGASLFAQNPANFYSGSKLKEVTAKLAAETKKSGSGFASETLERYGNHYTMLAHREASGSSELHVKDADVFFIIDGDCTILTGGKMVKGKQTAENEIRGVGIEGGSKRKLAAGDVVHIQPNTPHQMILASGHTITYFVVKVTQ